MMSHPGMVKNDLLQNNHKMITKACKMLNTWSAYYKDIKYNEHLKAGPWPDIIINQWVGP
jgi:hypothetical protein